MLQAKALYFSGEIPQGDPEGDQRNLFRKLHLLSKEREHIILTSFLHCVGSVVKEEWGQLTRSERELMPPFESVLDLTDHVLQLRKTRLGAAVERVLVLVFQLGCFIAYHEAHPLEYDYQAANTSLIARGPGLLSAAAIGFSPSLSMIPSIAGEITRVAFRFGLVVDQVCRSLEASPQEINAEGAWVYCAYGIDENEARQAVSRFNIERAYPETTQAAVFNVDDKSVSICGPPSTLRALFSESELFKHTKNVPMKKVQGMWHSGKIYGMEHIKQIVPEIKQERRLHLPLYSPVTGNALEAMNPTSVLEQIMEEMLTQTIHWDLAIDGATNQLRQLSPKSTRLISIQTSHYVESLLDHWRSELPKMAVSSQDMMSEILNLPLENSPPRDAKSSKIAVVGMSCRFPGGADDTEKFWELLVQGRDVHCQVPPDRFDVESHIDPTGKRRNTSKTPFGCFVDNPGLFDAMFFGMSPREAEQTDPMHRLALVTAYEALESSGYVHGRGINPRRVGTFYGQASDDYREVNSGQDISTYFIPGGCRAFAPGRINYFFKFWGPSFSIDTACSSSLAAIQAACTSLWSSDVDMAIAGGLNILTNSDVYAGLSNGHFLSPTGGCKTWDETADGYCRADGVGSVVLKRLEDAEANNDNIIGVILSAATDHSAEAVSITHPHDAAQAFLYSQVVKRAGIDPLSVGYVEMHGTGTQAGDTNEMRSVTSVFAPGAAGNQPRQLPLYIGTVKANMGHGEAAAGIMAFIKSMLVLQKGIIPPHVGIKTRLNPSLPRDLDQRNVVIPYNEVSWGPCQDQTRLAMVNNFGAAGGNTSIILQEPKPRPRIGLDTRKAHVITVSAKSALSLQENIKRLLRYIETRQEISLSDLSYTLSARRMHYGYRVSVLASSLSEAKDDLLPHVESSSLQIPHHDKKDPVAFAFTGQGTFYVGIGADLYRDSFYFRQQIDQLDSLARRQKFPSFLSIVDRTCPSEEISMISMHLAIVCVEIALARLWGSFGIRPSVVVGHSLGEYAALTVAGVLSDSDAIFLVGTRATLLSSVCTPYTHGMLSVRASAANIKKEVAGLQLEIACINGPNETVVGGSISDLEVLSSTLTTAGYKCVRLDVAHAYHTSQMDAFTDAFISQTKAVVCKKPKIRVISPQYSEVMDLDDELDVSYLVSSTRKAVDFVGGLNAAWDAGVVSESTIWLEVGHHPTCSGFISRTLPSTRLVCSSLHRDNDNWTTMAKTLCAMYCAGIDIDWNEYHRPFEQVLRLLDVPTYAWNNKNYWIQYRGDWNLTKGRAPPEPTTTPRHGFHTSSIHRIISENYNESQSEISAETSMTDPLLEGVVDGHAMNGYGVASSFLHADMAFTLAKRILDQKFKTLSSLGINVSNFEYHEPVIKLQNSNDPQPIHTTIEADLDKMEAKVKWYNPAKDLWYCHATITFENTSSWMSTWARSAKLVTSRIEALNIMAETGKASKITTDLAYSLFGKLVDYSRMYRTMQWVILNEDEAIAEVRFPSDTSGAWTFPPHFIDGVVSLSGFILNGGTHFDNTNNFFITPSWKSMRFAKPLTPKGHYLAYVRMVPVDAHSFAGDVYILQNSEIVGVVEAILFRQWPRVMLNRFFSPPNASKTIMQKTAIADSNSISTPFSTLSSTADRSDDLTGSPVLVPTPGQESESREIMTPDRHVNVPGNTPMKVSGNSRVITRALTIVSEELAVDVGLLVDEALITDLGLDSLMSLVVSQRLREELGIEIRDAFFMEISTIGDLKRLIH